MVCVTCQHAMLSTSSQVFEEEKGAMTITRWRCRSCHETAEEIWSSAGYRGSRRTGVRYAAMRSQRRKAPVAACPAATRGTEVYAGGPGRSARALA